MKSSFPQCKLDALNKVKEIMDEHFEGWVLSYETELHDESDITATIYSGGKTRAVGLLVLAQDELRQSNRQQEE